MNKPAQIEASLHSAMAAAFAEIDGALKSAKNPHFKSKYADITAVIESIKPALIRHGLFFTQRPEPSERGITIETVLGHASGEEISLGKLYVPANKNDPQGFGSALTYARRYALVTAFGVPTEDDDGNAAKAAMRGQEHSQEDAVSPAPKQPAHSKLKTELRGWVHELNGVGDADELNGFLATKESVRIIKETKEKLPHLWDGSDWPESMNRPEEFVPIADLISKRQAECAKASAEYMTQ